ncbi:hypothetical protein GCM10017673_38550 [Streptosporangium violaceochromogenes]|nr:hypothetical protein GCM10017673_38550 [Streptosporangium violaceochromogenes]
MTPPTTIPRYLTHLRQNQELSQTRIAQAAGVSGACLSRLESGHAHPSLPTAVAWAAALRHEIGVSRNGETIGEIVALLPHLPTLRTDSGLSQTHLALHLYVVRGAITELESRIRAGARVHLATIARYLRPLGCELTPVATPPHQEMTCPHAPSSASPAKAPPTTSHAPAHGGR